MEREELIFFMLAALAFWESAFAAEIEVAWKSPNPHVPGKCKKGQKTA
jgi:hypothetical protein